MVRYRKQGSVIRIERARGERAVVRVRESGEALETEQEFTARPIDGESPADPAEDQLMAFEKTLDGWFDGSSQSVERLVLSSGVAQHEVGEVRWQERSLVMHLSLVNRATGVRCVIDRGGTSTADFGELEEILGKWSGEGATDVPGQLILSSPVAAALLPALLEKGMANVVQQPGGMDGCGQMILPAHQAPWPNVFRPSYRFRPIRVPLNLAATPFGSMEGARFPEAVALCEYPQGLSIHVLCRDQRGLFPCRATIRRVLAVQSATTWFPLATGAHGARMLVEVVGGQAGAAAG